MKGEERKRYFVAIVVRNFIGEEYCYAEVLSTTDRKRGRSTILDIMHTKGILPEEAEVLEKMCFEEYRNGLENYVGWHNTVLDDKGKLQWIKKSQGEIDDIFDYSDFVPDDSNYGWDTDNCNEWNDCDYNKRNNNDDYDDDGSWEETLRINQMLIDQGDY